MLCVCGLLPWTLPARAEEPPPPKVRRTYGERAHLSGSTSATAEPEAKSTARIPKSQIPGGVSSPVGDFESARAPALPMPVHDPAAERGEKNGKPWSMLDETSETKPSGWGWLADEIKRSAAESPNPARKNGEEPLEEDGERADPENWNSPFQAEDEPDALARPEMKSATPPMTEEEMVQARLKEFDTDTNPGWRPVGVEQDGADWPSAVEAKNDPRDRTALAGMAFQAPEAVQNPIRQNAPDVDALTRSSASPDFLQNINRLPTVDPNARPGESVRAAEDLSVLPTFNARPTSSSLGSLTEATPSAGAGGVSFGLPASLPALGGLSAVDVPPTLGSAAPLAPALGLPSQAASTPSMGVMGSEMEARPKTLPW